MKRLLVVLAVACAPDALEPPGHVLMSLTTDAPLPAAPGDPPAEVAPLFDRLRIEIVPEAASEPCAGCSREIAVDRELLDPASFTVTGEHGRSGIRVRVRLYRSGGTASGEPRAASTIDVTALLPAIPDEGGLARHLVLRTDDVGVPKGTLDQPLNPADGSAPSGLVGSFWGASPRPCSGEPEAGAVCIPGGAVWMGNPRLDLGATPELDGAREHLIVRSPVWLDAHEVSVAEFRASGLAISLSPGGPSDNPHEAGTGIEHCTYTSAPGDNDSHPVNCISWSLAKKFCESRGGRLPTEAELEAAGSALGRSAYVWGADAPECGDAVFDRADPTDACATDGTGPLPSGSGVRDRLALPTGEVVDLAGNVREWTLDRWNREDEPCWSAPILQDPRCETPSVVDGDARATRGGHFDDVPALLQASVRSWLANEEQAVSALIGVRCARDD